MTIVRHSAAFAFVSLLLLHDPIIALTSSALAGHTLLAFGMVWFSVSMILQLSASGRLHWVGQVPTFCTVFVLAGLGTFYSLIDSGNFNVRVQFLATFLLMPFIWVAFSELASQPSSRRRVHWLLLFYVGTELTIMLLQVAYFVVGFGLPPGDLYESMVSGSQFNGNNLAAIIVVLSIFYNASSREVTRFQRRLFNLITMSILLITFSRLAILLYIFDRLRSLRVKQLGKALALTTVLVAAGLVVGNIEYTGNETIDSSLYKAKSLAAIAELGFEADSSTSSRGESYYNFFDQLGSLGIGTATILNYWTFTSSGTFADQALYVNPHSMVIEFGYWMGWPGLLVLGALMLVAYMRTSQGGLLQRGFVLMAVLFASSIPSSAIPLPSFWASLLLLAMLGAYTQPMSLSNKSSGSAH